MAAAKNMALNPAVQDLGLGDSIRQQLDDAEEERKRKMAQAGQGSLLGEATRTLFPGTFSV